MEINGNAFLGGISDRKPPRDDVYTDKDGIKRCKRCNQPVEKLLCYPQLGINKTVNVICGCELEERSRREKQEKIDAAKRLCFGVEMGVCEKQTFERDNGRNPQMKIAKSYAEHFSETLEDGTGNKLPRGKGLLIYGTVGTGKSYMAAAIANYVIEHGDSALFTNFVEIGNKLKNFEAREAVMKALKAPSLLIIDDLGVEKANDYLRSIMFDLVDMRTKSLKPLIVTTNITKKELQETQDVDKARIYDRLIERCLPVEVIGASQRRLDFAKDYQASMRILRGE